MPYGMLWAEGRCPAATDVGGRPQVLCVGSADAQGIENEKKSEIVTKMMAKMK